MKPKVCLFLFWTNFQLCLGYPAVVIVPVADLISTPASKLCPELSVTQYYNQIPLAATDARKDPNSCPRQHQALFHELVEVVEEGPQEAKIKIKNAYYLNLNTGHKFHSFWTLKSNLKPLNQIKYASNFLPAPIDYLNSKSVHAPHTITLIRPYQQWSVGTRFALLPEQTSKHHYLAYCYNSDDEDHNPDITQFIKIKIPKRFAKLGVNNSSKDQLRAEFVKLVELWTARHRRLTIPYVWGGCSYLQRLPMPTFEIIARPGCQKELSYYQVPSNPNRIQTGFDCSGLTLRAAQAAGLPYFYKNTATLAHELQELSEADPILPGDLIWIQGHVIIITDPKKNLCIEARDYGHGYGCVQQIRIDQLFKETTNLNDLKTAALTKKNLSRLDKSGQVVGTYQVKLLKLI